MNNTKKYIKSDKKVLKERFGLEMRIEKSKHLKITISDGVTDYQLASALTPSDRRGRMNQIAQFRRVLRKKFDKRSKTSDFLIGYTRTIED